MRGGRAASSVLQLYGEIQHETQQGSASGDTNSRKGLQVAGIRGVLVAPLDQESPGSSPQEGQLKAPHWISPVRRFPCLRVMGGAA
jgi:hypothetical protein